MPRKHLIASGINKKQQQQAKLWMKCAKEIKAAAKVGGPNPEANPRLKAAIARALNCNLSRESIEKNINGATKDQAAFKEMFYEGYGPNGLAILIKVLTDNEQRAVSAIRGYFSKLHGQLAKPNSVKMIFEELGEIIFDAHSASEDDILNATIENDIVDLVNEEDYYILYTKPNDFYAVKENLEQHHIPFISAEIKYIANQKVDVPDDQMDKVERFLAACEEDDDISWVEINMN